MPAIEPFYAEEALAPQTFPSIVIGPQGRIQPQGSFAEAQAQVSFDTYVLLGHDSFVCTLSFVRRISYNIPCSINM